jgi:hypothetical protein
MVQVAAKLVARMLLTGALVVMSSEDSRIASSVRSLSRGRLRLFQPMRSIGEEMPEDAVVLTHDTLLIMGMDRNWVSDQNQVERRRGGVCRSP